jgi:hypothetical protein
MFNNATGFRFAELARGDSLQSPDVCDCCGREGLKRTVKLVSPGGTVVWYGVGCAARAMSVGVDVVRAARRDAAAALEANEAVARRERDRAEDAAWQAFLDRAAGPGPDRFSQIQRLGGIGPARAAWRAET